MSEKQFISIAINMINSFVVSAQLGKAIEYTPKTSWNPSAGRYTSTQRGLT